MAKNIIIKKLSLPQNDWHSLLRGAFLTALGAAITYVLANISQTDFGDYTYIIVPLITIILNYTRKVVLNESDSIAV